MNKFTTKNGNTIEFVENKKYALYNGEESTNKWFIKTFGCKCIRIFSNKVIQIDNNIYISGKITVGRIINEFCKFEKHEEYDYISNKGYGQITSDIKESIISKEGSFIISKISYNQIKNCNILSISQMKINYPNLNLEKFKVFESDFDEYYKSLHYNSNN